MFWHIDTDIVALIVVCALYVYNKRLPVVQSAGERNRRFLWCLRLGIAATVVDIAASVVMESPVSPIAYQLMMMLSFTTMQLAIIAWFYYAIAILYEGDGRGMRAAFRWVMATYLIYCAVVFSNPWTGWFFTLGAGNEYNRGPLFFLVPLVYALYALALLGLTLARRKHIPSDYPRAVIVLIPIIVGAAVAVQLSIPGWLMALPGYMLCLVLVFLFFQTERARGEREQLHRLTELVENFSCGLAIWHIGADKSVTLEYMTEGYAELCEEPREAIYERCRHDPLPGVHPDDREVAKQRLERLVGDMTTDDFDYRYVTQGGKTKWFNIRTKVVRNPDGSGTCYATYTDLTEQKKLQQQLADTINTVPSGICLYRWDGEGLHPILANERLSELLGRDAVTHLKTVSTFDYKLVHPEDMQALQEASREALESTHHIDHTFRIRNTDSGEYMWLRQRGTLIEQPDGSHLAYISYNDVTRERVAERKLRELYELERRRPSLGEETLLVYSLFDLNTGEALEYAYHDGSPVPLEDRTAFEYGIHNIDRLLIVPEEREAFRLLNDSAHLLERFEQGETEFQLDYRRRLPGGEIGWVRNIVHLLRQPGGSHVLAFEYYYNVEEEKLQEQTFRSLSYDSFDYVAHIRLGSGSYALYPKAEPGRVVAPVKGDDLDAAISTVFAPNVFNEDRDVVAAGMSVSGIRERLKRQERAQLMYREAQPDGSVLYKRITQHYLDERRELVLMTREDVSAIMRQEAERNDMLASALGAARQASEAKSQFLSRVSHELRTPLNAIIGFMELARDADEQQMRLYLDNSDVAAKQLLSIINDVLDMSSIESGKLKLAYAPFDFKHMIHAITNLYLSQCHQKGLAFETKVLSPISDWLVGDKLRLNQILLNLLNNAVKFTEQGHVWLTVRQLNEQGDKVFLRFEVSDTGCGISEEMRTRLFKPFEQESAATAQRFGGSGLGLSIVNSLVGMMDGAIRVDSVVGEGTTFTVDLPFARSETGEHEHKPEIALRVLAMDDEPAEREYISTVLERIGVRHACLGDADEAMQELRSAKEQGDEYAVCLIDWRMAKVSGEEMTRRIRELYGDSMVVIVISAYEPHQVSESAKAAGADMFVTKPLFQSSLLDLFMTLTDGRIAKRTARIADADYTGRRVMLVEDNALNRMVAEGLLAKYKVECHSAENGQIAVERFLASPEGYYDAILMDVQMPVMDGYEASRLIRASAHPDAKTVQIIALTANAFNEDIARSLSNGMNAHITKPIEPDALLCELDKAFQKK